MFSKLAVWAVILLVLGVAFKQLNQVSSADGTMPYSDFLDAVQSRQIKSVTLQEGGTGIVAVNSDGKKIRVTATFLDRGLIGDLRNNGVKFDVKPREEQGLLM